MRIGPNLSPQRGPTMAETTYILVHGAWGGAWCWSAVGDVLTRRGVNWTALDLPSSTHGAHPNTYLADDAHEVVEVAKLEGSVVLVGHSYGGAVITEAADQVPSLERLIYIAALVPNLGQSVSEAILEVDVKTRLDVAIERDGDFLRLNPLLATAALYQDCTEEVAARAVGALSTQTVASFRSPRSAFDVEAPSYYLRCDLDQAIDPSLQEVMSARCHEVARIASGHSPMFSMPEALCDLILSTT
jgi:pimeloyl-ACP methyl ester carboxylesterase